MARMIPQMIDPECRSGGEREVFQRLRDDPGTADWIVLHSLALARHEKRVEGEVDFVLIIPSKGVLCLEVKGCSAAHLRRADGLWFYGIGDKGTARSPFQQVSEAMHSLQRQLISRDRTLATIQFSCGVVFPFAPFTERSLEWHEWQVIDSCAFRSMPIGRLTSNLMDAARAHLTSVKFGPTLSRDAPTIQQCRAILDALRPNFEIPVDPKMRAGALNRELLRYTSEQLLALDAMAENPRTIFTGPAGTGKTFLALEVARRAHAAGRRALLVCFNRLLGLWLDQQTIAFRSSVQVGTLHRCMLSIARIEPKAAQADFWETRLPEAACERLLDARDESVLYDELIVDEAQDILREPYLDFLDLSLRGGLAAGHWRMFGDFENAAIYGAANLPIDLFRQQRSGNAPLFSLRVNCRNTPLIAEYVHLLGGLNPPYRRVLRPDDGIHPEIRFYEDQKHQAGLLSDAMNGLRKCGFAPDDIVVLSPLSGESCASLLAGAGPWKGRLRPMGSSRPDSASYGSIHAFKGLEAPAVVVTDIESIGTPAVQALLYVAVTRALQRLIVLAADRVRTQLLETLQRLSLVATSEQEKQ